MYKGRLSGEKIDLFHVIKEMGNNPETGLDPATMEKVKPILEQYDIELVDAIRRREEASRGSSSQLIISKEDHDDTRQIQLIEKMVSLHKAVRDVNDRYVEAIAAVLPEDRARAFREKVVAESFQQAFRPTPLSRMIKAALELPDLDESTKAAVLDIKARHDARMQELTDALVRKIRESEPAQIIEREKGKIAARAGVQAERKADPVIEQLRERDRVSQEFADQLRAALTPEQYAMLPGANRIAEINRGMGDRGDRGVGNIKAGDRGGEAQDPLRAPGEDGRSQNEPKGR
jgi:hypothetical protein